MKWVTRKRIHVNRTATGWLIRRFLDPSGEILFVEPEDVASIQETRGAVGFDELRPVSAGIVGGQVGEHLV